MDFCTGYLVVNLLIFAAGLWLLIKGSDIFIDAAADIARHYHVSELTIGLTLVSIGTSLPELASSAYAACFRQHEFIVGNIVGSITTNITLILGMAALIGGAMPFPRKLLTRDALCMLATFVVTIIMTYCVGIADAHGMVIYGLNRICSAILLAGAVWYCWMLLKDGVADGAAAIAADGSEEKKSEKRTNPAISYLFLLLGLGMVLGGSKLLLDNVIWCAKQLNVSTMMISVTIVAFGTSVPELAVTVAGVMKKRHELAIGNIIGSCTFNILLIFGICGLINPLEIVGGSGLINMAVMLLSGVLLTLCMLGKSLNRKHGAVLLLLYVGFLIYNCREFWLR